MYTRRTLGAQLRPLTRHSNLPGSDTRISDTDKHETTAYIYWFQELLLLVCWGPSHECSAQGTGK